MAGGCADDDDDDAEMMRLDDDEYVRAQHPFSSREIIVVEVLYSYTIRLLYPIAH
jgi:hypothetical protein